MEINHNHLLEILFMLHDSQIAQTIVSTERWETVAMVPRGMMKWLNKSKFLKLLMENVSVPLNISLLCPQLHVGLHQIVPAGCVWDTETSLQCNENIYLLSMNIIIIHIAYRATETLHRIMLRL